MATYADGTTIAEAGDVVERIECAKPDDMVPVGRRFVVGAVHPACDDELYLEGVSLSWFSRYFKLISRAHSPAKDEPLVKWPEEKLVTYEMLKCGELFVASDEPQVVRVKTSIAYYVNISGQHVGTSGGLSPQAPVRRIQFNPDNKEPVFVVI